MTFLSFADNGPCLGWRDGPNKPYQWLHYNETLLRAKNFGSGLVSLGLAPGPQTLIGLYSQNCPEWVLTEQACYTYSLVVVPLYDTLGPDACAYIINQAEINVVVCEDDQKCNLLLDKAPRYVTILTILRRKILGYSSSSKLSLNSLNNLVTLLLNFLDFKMSCILHFFLLITLLIG